MFINLPSLIDFSAASPTATAINPSLKETSGTVLFLIAFKNAKCS